MAKIKKITKKGTTEAVSKSTVRHPGPKKVEDVENHIEEERATEPPEIEPEPAPPTPDETDILTVKDDF